MQSGRLMAGRGPRGRPAVGVGLAWPCWKTGDAAARLDGGAVWEIVWQGAITSNDRNVKRGNTTPAYSITTVQNRRRGKVSRQSYIG